MFFHKTLSLYLFKSFCKSFIIVTSVLITVLILSNIFDILQKFKSIYIPFSLFWKLAICKIPYLVNEIAALISFISMLFFLRKIIRHNELLIILCSGIPLWRVLIIPIIAIILIGIFMVSVLSPIGIYGMKKYELIEISLTKKKPNNMVLPQSGIFFFEEYQNSNRLIQVERIIPLSNEIHNITMLFVDSQNNFIQRVDSIKAILDDGKFSFLEPVIVGVDSVVKHEELTIPTNLTISNLINSFISPEMISFWNLSSVIYELSKSGLPVLSYQLYYCKLLFKPLAMIATAILSCCCLSFKARDRSYKRMLINGTILGFSAYILIEIISRILSYNGLQPFFAVLLPICLLIFIGNFIILHLYQD